jgi:hypothetical protein
LEHEALYINRAKLVVKASGVAHSREMAEVDYSVDYYIHVATREDAVQLVQHMPHWSHPSGQVQGLRIEDINAYVGPVIENVVNQLVQLTPLEQIQSPQMQDLSQLVRKPLQQFLSLYGITVDEMNVRIAPRDEYMKVLLSLKAFGLSELDAVRHYTSIKNDASEHRLKTQKEEIEHEVQLIWHNKLNRYTEEIAAIQAELERTRADFDLHSARLQELARVISSELRANIHVTSGTDLRGEGHHTSNVGTGLAPLRERVEGK